MRLAPAARTMTDEVHAMARWIETAIEAGVDIVQIREPDLCARQLCDLVRGAAGAAARTLTRIVVNDRADVARAAGAAGVHLPSRGLPADMARRLDADWLLGRSVHDDDADVGEGLDYVIFGTVFRSRSKPGDAPPAGLSGLRRAVGRFEQPVLAIGGIDLDRVTACFEQGAAGIAAIGLFLPAGSERGSAGPAEAVRAIRAAFLDARPRSGVDLLE